MSLLADYHLHTSFSGDSDTPMSDMIDTAIEKGLTQLCITEHFDPDYPHYANLIPGTFDLDTPSYYKHFLEMQKKYKDKITLCFGVELGLQPHLSNDLKQYVSSHPFDFIIGSSHVVNRQDPYYPDFYEGKTEKEAYRLYFETIYETITKFDDFDVYGHLDYIIRYGPTQDKNYYYKDFSDIFDAILTLLIRKNIGLEVNTGGLKNGLKDFHPKREILMRYKELGGSILTIGSDAHKINQVGHSFDDVAQLLTTIGFKYYTVFQNRKPEFRPI
ncbi:MAG: histidinol-phosphatase HisJ family protein [Lachnospiraceae bacterium]